MNRTTLAMRGKQAAAVAFLLAMTAFLALSSTARADGTPDISATVSSSATLYGQPVAVRMSASNPSTEPYGYNLSFRVVLPEGVSYLNGGGVVPKEIVDQPEPGERTLIFSNVSDLSEGSTREFAFNVEYSDTIYDAGDSFPVAIEAFVNEDPRFIPKFDAEGEPEGPSETSFTGHSEETVGALEDTVGIQTLKAIDVNIAEPSPEGEILRGVHDHQTVYTATVTNNGVNPTTETKLDVYLPAGLEFLGCGGAGMDNTTDAPTNPEGGPQEYPGSGAIENSLLAGCVEPESVETEVVDPDGAGPLPEGVYTHVVWPVGALGDGETKTFPYRAAVPIRANTETFTGTRPSAASGNQAANLDNNSGDEVVDETALRTYATASGIYQGKTPTPASDAEELLRTAEDWVVRKSGSSTALAQDAITKWTLVFETAEYKFVDDATITDTLPDGLCPLDASENLTSENDAPDGECDPVGGQEPTADYASATENSDGSWTLTWDKSSWPALAHTGVNDKLTLEFPTRTRTHYQENEVPQSPILTHDSILNKVTTSASGFARCTAPGTPDCSETGPTIDHDGIDGSTIVDASEAGQEAGGAIVDKEIATSYGGDCLTATYTESVPHYQPGDTICWKIRVEFPSTLDTSPQAIADYLPPGTQYVPGSEAATSEDNVIAAVDDSEAGDGLLTWTVSGSTVPAGSTHVLERVFATTVAPLGTVVDGDLKGNLLKFASENTPGESIPQRDEANYVIDAPVLSLTKGVRTINGAPVGGKGPNVDGGTVKAGDFVEYRVDVTNEGSAPTWSVSLRSILEDGIVCTDVQIVSHTGGCGGGHVNWAEEISIMPGATETYIYVVKMPSGVEPGRRFDDRAGIVSYQSSTNEFPVPGTFTYTPANNIAGIGSANAPAADDPSWVETRAVQFTKTRTTAVEEAGNNATSQATIGEPINYKATLTVPEGTTVYDAEFRDIAGSARHSGLLATGAKLNGGPLPGEFTVAEDPFEVGLIVDFPPAYTNAAGSGDDVFEFTISTRVADNANNSRVSPKETITNTAHFLWKEQGGAAHDEPASVNTTVVEPNVAVTKTDNDPDKKVSPGQAVEYTLTASNVNGTRVSVAHELSLVDKVPAGLTPALPIANGGIWSEAERTITWFLGSLTPGQAVQRKYAATVDIPAVANSIFNNKAKLTATSLIGAIEGERGPGSPIETGYVANAEDTVSLGDATLTKSVEPGAATIGDEVTYTTEVTFPAHVEFYDTTVIDTLPDGLLYDETVSVTCSGGPCEPPEAISGTELPPEPQPDGTTEVAWFLDFLPAFPEPRTFEIVYKAHVADKYDNGVTPVEGGETLTNLAEAFYNGSETIPGTPTSIPDPSEFTGGSGPDTADIDVVEPNVSIAKEIKAGNGAFSGGPTAAHSDQTMTYRLTVANDGESPAYDVEVSDQPNAALTDVQLEPQAGVTVTDGWSEADPDVGWRIDGPIAPSGSVTLTYTAKFVAASQLHDGQSVPNTASVPHYFAAPKATRDANPGHVYRDYTNGGSDSTEAVLDFPTLSLLKTTGLGGNPDTGNAEIGQSFPWRIVVSNSSTTAGAANVRVRDVLPPNWAYIAGSATLMPGGVQEPVVTPAASGDALEWTIPTLAPGGSATIAFAATPSTAAAVNPGTGPGANVNAARVTAAIDEAGNPGNGDGAYETGPDNATATLLVPDLNVVKTPDGASATAGSPASFTVKVENNGSATARDVDVVDVLPDGVSYTPGTAIPVPSAGFSETEVAPGPGSGQTTVKWRISSLPAAESVTVTVPVAVEPDVGDGTTLTNTARATSKETPDPVEDEGSLAVGAEADMSIAKTGDSIYTAGTQYTWHLRVRNLGPSDAQGVTVGDPLPAGTSFVSASAPCVLSGTEVACSLGTVPDGFDQTYDVTVAVDPATTTSPLSNTATVDTTTDDPEPDNDTSTFGPTASPLADVWVEKIANPEAILKNHETTFTIVAHNDGPSVAREVSLTDVLPAGLQFVSTDEPPCANQLGTVSCELGDLAPGGEATVQITVKGIVNGIHLNTVEVDTSTPEPSGHKPNTASDEVEVGPVAELGIVKEGPATVAADGQLTYTLTVTNNGPDDATGVTIVDTLPAGTLFASADSGCLVAAGIVTCDVGALAATASAQRQITVTVPRALADTTIVNSATVHGDQGDDEPENDSDEAETKVGPSADLSIAKTGPNRVNANGVMTWTLAVANAGPSTATAVKVFDALPAGVELRSATPTQGSCATASGGVECALGTIAKGGAAQIQVVADVPPALEGATLVNAAAVAGEEPDPDPSNNESEATTIVDPPAPSDYDLSIRKTIDEPAKPAFGEVLRYSIVVANHGPAKATGVKVTDALPGSVEYVSASLPGGKCSRDGAVVTCRLASLAVGAEARASVAVRLLEAGSLRNTATVSAAVADANPNNNRSTARAKVALEPSKIQVSKTRVGRGAVEPGEPLRFKIRVRNVGKSAAADVVVCDRLPATMSFAKLRGASLEQGDACWTIEMLSAGASRTFSLTARVDGGFGGGGVRNVAFVKADNAPASRGVAGVRVRFDRGGRGGGVTG